MIILVFNGFVLIFWFWTQKTNKGHGSFAQISSEFIDFSAKLTKFWILLENLNLRQFDLKTNFD